MSKKEVTQTKYSITPVMVLASFTEFFRNKRRVLKGNTQHQLQVTGIAGYHPCNSVHSLYFICSFINNIRYLLCAKYIALKNTCKVLALLELTL